VIPCRLLHLAARVGCLPSGPVPHRADLVLLCRATASR